MQRVACFSASARDLAKEDIDRVFLSSLNTVDAWLSRKGLSAESGRHKLPDSREVDLSIGSIDLGWGKSTTWTLTEPVAAGWFQTELTIGHCADGAGLFCALSAGDPEAVIGPDQHDVHCPIAVREILRNGQDWWVGSTRISHEPIRLYGITGGGRLVDLIDDPDRTLPIVVVSQAQGFTLHPSLTQRLADELIAVALVAEIDDEASWQVTRRLGTEWSCFQGSLRLYWPKKGALNNPRQHPLWTSRRLLNQAPDHKAAADRIRNQLRKRLLGMTPLTVVQPPEIAKLEIAVALDKLESRFAEAKENADNSELIKMYEGEIDSLNTDIAELKSVIKTLRTELATLRIQQEWRGADGQGVLPDEHFAPSTVAEAVSVARKVFVQDLTFGDSVKDSCLELSDAAGPPDKVYQYFEVLGWLAEAKRKGPLGKTMIEWLREWDVHASLESETTRKDRNAMSRRKWHDGRGLRQFELHLKPSNVTSPDKVVRIYFDWDEATEKIVIGYVGRHLD